MKRIIAVLALLFWAGVFGTLPTVLATPASAQASAADGCTSSAVTHSVKVSGWPDRGRKFNFWAEKEMTRSFKVCATATPQAGDWTYKAIATDTGTFITKEGASPAGTATLQAGVKGEMSGGFTATFTGPKLLAFTPSGVTSVGYLENGDWIPAVFPGAKLTDFLDWHWTYTTCSETHKQAEPDVFEGDITGKPCPSPAATPTQTPAPGDGLPSPSPDPTYVPEKKPILPVTGFPLFYSVIAAFIVISVGGALVYLTRSQRRKYVV